MSHKQVGINLGNYKTPKLLSSMFLITVDPVLNITLIDTFALSTTRSQTPMNGKMELFRSKTKISKYTKTKNSKLVLNLP